MILLQWDSVMFLVCLQGPHPVSLGQFGVLHQSSGDVSILSTNVWHAGMLSTGAVLFGYLDRITSHKISDAKGAFGHVLDEWDKTYSLAHVHCSAPNLVNELKQRLN